MNTIAKLPTDDSPESISVRMQAVYNGQRPVMPKLSSMTKKEMAKTLQSLWTFLDEVGIQRRNETSPQTELNIYGRVYASACIGPLPPSDYGKNRQDAPNLKTP